MTEDTIHTINAQKVSVAIQRDGTLMICDDAVGLVPINNSPSHLEALRTFLGVPHMQNIINDECKRYSELFKEVSKTRTAHKEELDRVRRECSKQVARLQKSLAAAEAAPKVVAVTGTYGNHGVVLSDGSMWTWHKEKQEWNQARPAIPPCAPEEE
jgi:hypothetical protein